MHTRWRGPCVHTRQHTMFGSGVRDSYLGRLWHVGATCPPPSRTSGRTWGGLLPHTPFLSQLSGLSPPCSCRRPGLLYLPRRRRWATRCVYTILNPVVFASTAGAHVRGLRPRASVHHRFRDALAGTLVARRGALTCTVAALYASGSLALPSRVAWLGLRSRRGSDVRRVSRSVRAHLEKRRRRPGL